MTNTTPRVRAAARLRAKAAARQDGHEAGASDRRRLVRTPEDEAHYVAVAMGNLEPGAYRAGYLDGLTGVDA